jgi:dipeptidyl aminopeptidase/acylaminoacyl peptidase
MSNKARSFVGCCAVFGMIACQPQPTPEIRRSPPTPRAKAPHEREAEAPVDTSGYRLPPREVVKIVDAEPTPMVRVGPKGQRMMIAPYRSNPPIAVVAEPFLRLAGMRIHPDLGARRQLRYSTAYTFQTIADGTKVEAELPGGARIATSTWSPDGTKVAAAIVGKNGLEPWLIEVRTGEARRLVERRLNNVLGSPMRWIPGSKGLLVRLRPEGQGAPPEPSPVPRGPVIQDTAGEKAQNRTYQDLLQNADDEASFVHFATSVLAVVDVKSGTVTTLGEPGLVADAAPAPDGSHVLAETIHEPFSYQVPYYRFPHTIEVWNASGKKIHTVADLPLMDAVPIEGVPTGPRSAEWQPFHPATLQWVEALDDGDPKKKVPHRDRIMRHAAPFQGEPEEITKIEHRYRGTDFTERKDEMFVTEYDRDRRWLTTRWHAAGAEPKVLFDRSRRDRYGDPGRPVHITLECGTRVVKVEDGAIYLAGSGATPEGDRPFLDRMKLEDMSKERLFQATAESYAYFVDFAGEEGAFVIRRESPKDPPNHFLVEDGKERALTEFPDPHPQLTGIEKKLLTYKRRDGVPLSGTLYLPPGWDGETRLPLLVWAYPIEYTDKKTAGQVRARPNRFTRLAGTSPLMFLTQGYAVLDGAAMPVIGHPETMNDTLIPQLVQAARAAIDAVVKEGVADRERVAISGHSYGAFMTANLLAHSDLFRAGIARSGAYNRTLTPFGFQSERRTLWEGQGAYIKVSPLFSADEIDEPLLMFHGADDNNSGTYPLQSRRLFHAMKGLGGTARLVMLPNESHGYRARESILHVLAESFEWLDTHVKNPKKPDDETRTARAD